MLSLFAAGTARANPPIPLLPEGPAPATGQPEVQVHGYLQTDGIAWAQNSEDQLTPSTSEPLNQERLLIRRARLEADVRRGRLLGMVEIDANTVRGPTTGLASAEFSYLAIRSQPELPDLFMASLGLLRIPFGAEVQERDRDRLFLERSNVGRALFPGAFDLAARLQARWRSLVLQLAATNGDPAGSGKYALQNTNAAKDLAGRLAANIVGSGRLRVEGGVSFLQGKGFHPGTPATKEVLVWRDQNEDGIVQTSEIQIIPGTPATPSRNFQRFAVGCDLRLVGDLPRLGQVTAFGEVVWASNLDRALLPADPVGSGRDLRELGIVAGITQELGGHLVLGARYDWYNADLDAAKALPVRIVPSSAVFSTTAFVVAWRFSSLDRIAVEFDLNRNPLGRGSAGLPANLPSDTLTVRAQLAY